MSLLALQAAMMAAASAGPPATVVREDVTVSVFTAATSHPATMPAVVNAGDLLVAQVGIANALAIATPSGWSLVDTEARGATETSLATMAIYAKVADGTEDGSTVDFATTTSCQMVVAVHRFQAGTFNSSLLYAFGANSATAAPDCPAVPIPWGASDTYALAMSANRFNEPYSAYPAGYTEGRRDASSPTTGNQQVVTLASAAKQLSSVVSEDPGSMAISTSRDWAAQTLLIGSAGIPALDGPVVAERFGQYFSTTTTAHNVTMPATVNAGDLLVVVFCNASAATVTTITTPSGWTKLSEDAGGSVCNMGIYYRVADGSEDGTTVNFVTSASRRATAMTYRIVAGTFDSSTPIEVGPLASGASATPAIPAYSPSWGVLDTLTIVAAGADNLRASSSRMSGYSPVLQASGTTASLSTAASVYGAHAVYRNGSTWAAQFSISNAQTWVARAICIRPSP